MSVLNNALPEQLLSFYSSDLFLFKRAPEQDQCVWSKGVFVNDCVKERQLLQVAQYRMEKHIPLTLHLKCGRNVDQHLARVIRDSEYGRELVELNVRVLAIAIGV